MDALRFLVLSVALFGAGALLSLALSGISRAARITSGLMGTLASIVALVAAVQAARGNLSPLELPVPLPFGNLTLQMDSLSTLMVGLIALVGMAASFYSISYLGHHSDRDLGVLGFCANLFMALMMLVVTVTNAFYFLIFWEMMTLASYFLVTFESEKQESIHAGYLYMLVAHVGTVMILLSFFIFYISTGSFDFEVFRQSQLTPVVRDVVFLLAFFGFGAKAGIVPLHIWLPRAHPAAPSPASALLSGVMIKTALYGILRVCVDFLGSTVLWWGLLVLLFGAMTALLGVFFALAERDLKRALAYSSVENMGIILLGVGTGMIGLATQQPAVALIGLLAALYHVLNHSFFKGLLFLSAGAVDYRLGTRDLNEMGGLGKVMPWTGTSFLVGALALSAIPPLNGFVSEWFTYQAFLSGGGSQGLAVRISLPLCAALLAAVGTLAAMLAIKVYGGAFTGPARSQRAEQASEVPVPMLLGMSFLALGCVFLGLAAPVVAPYLVSVVADTFNVQLMTVAGGSWVFPVNMEQSALSTPLTAVLLLGLLIVPLILVAIYGGRRAGSRVVDDPWACGYGYSSRMSVTASSFDQPVDATFGRIYGLRAAMQRPMRTIGTWSKRAQETISSAEPVLENILKSPTTRVVDFLGRGIQVLQMGDTRMYCLYIVVTLAILLLVIFR